LDISNEKAEMIGCPLAEVLKWQGQRAKAEEGGCGASMRSFNLKAEWAQDRTKWKGLFGGNHPAHAGMENRTLDQ